MRLSTYVYAALLVILMILSVNLSTTLADSALVYFEATTNYYQAIVSPHIDWTTAKNAAASQPLPNICSASHLVTITSAAENQFIINNFSDDLVVAFLGGQQADNATSVDEGWEWITGEDFYGFTFWGISPRGPEPNDFGSPTSEYIENGEENYLNFTFAQPGTGWRTAWNDTTLDSDTAFSSVTRLGYIVEFECNQPPIADAGPDQSAPRNTDINFEGSFTNAEGADDAPFTVYWDFGDGTSYTETVNAPGQLNATHSYTALGFYTVTLCVTDGPGAQGCDTTTVEIYNRPPDCDTALPSIGTIWSPNHEMVPINIVITDPDGDPVFVSIQSISHNEDENGLGDGNTSPDSDGIGTPTALVRAERSGNGNGRTYTIQFFATDRLPNGDCDGVVSVFVPHDQRNNDNANSNNAGGSGEAGNNGNNAGGDTAGNSNNGNSGDIVGSNNTNSGDTAGNDDNSGDAPGNSGNTPAGNDGAPGNSGNTPGSSGDTPDNSGNTPAGDDGTPGNSGNAQGRN